MNKTIFCSNFSFMWDDWPLCVCCLLRQKELSSRCQLRHRLGRHAGSIPKLLSLHASCSWKIGCGRIELSVSFKPKGTSIRPRLHDDPIRGGSRTNLKEAQSVVGALRYYQKLVTRVRCICTTISDPFSE